MTELKLVEGSAVVLPAVAHCFRFAGYGSWAIFTLNDNTGELNIQSDWGCYAYRWNIAALGGKTLYQFLPECDPEYIVRKLKQNNRHELDDVLDVKATRQELLDHLAELDIGQSKHDAVQDEIDEWYDHDFSASYHDLVDLPEVIEDYGEYMVYCRSARYTFLHDSLLPFFLTWLNMYNKDKANESKPDQKDPEQSETPPIEG